VFRQHRTYVRTLVDIQYLLPCSDHDEFMAQNRLRYS